MGSCAPAIFVSIYQYLLELWHFQFFPIYNIEGMRLPPHAPTPLILLPLKTWCVNSFRNISISSLGVNIFHILLHF